MDRVPDRQQQRRTYLKKKRLALASIWMGRALLLLTLILFGCSVFGIVGFKSVIGTFLFAALTTICGILAAGALKWIEVSHRAAKLPYVPPVSPEEMPANEVLVRGASPPAGDPRAILLRPTAAGKATPPEQLLRATDRE